MWRMETNTARPHSRPPLQLQLTLHCRHPVEQQGPSSFLPLVLSGKWPVWHTVRVGKKIDFLSASECFDAQVSFFFLLHLFRFYLMCFLVLSLFTSVKIRKPKNIILVVGFEIG